MVVLPAGACSCASPGSSGQEAPHKSHRSLQRSFSPQARASVLCPAVLVGKAGETGTRQDRAHGPRQARPSGRSSQATECV